MKTEPSLTALACAALREITGPQPSVCISFTNGQWQIVVSFSYGSLRFFSRPVSEDKPDTVVLSELERDLATWVERESQGATSDACVALRIALTSRR